MPKNIPNYLKLHVEDATAIRPAEQPAHGYEQFCDAFEQATGWSLRVDSGAFGGWSKAGPLTGDDDFDSRRFALHPLYAPAAEDAPPPLELHKARRLAVAASQVLAELERTRQTVWRREAELAAGVPVVQRKDEEQHLAIRLESILQGGAEAIGCQAAAVYLLDDATTELKLRSAWGLPKQRLLEPARPLRGSVADLEALVGHAVVLEDTHLLPHWKVPEPYSSAVCVPISTPNEPLGTLWMFGDQVRDYSDDQTNLVEIIAGRVAAELQREILLNECVASKQIDRQLIRAADWQRDHLPNVVPLLDDWQVAGWTSDSAMLNSGFFDWFVPPDGTLAVALGQAEGSMMESALTAAALQGSVRAHSQYRHDACQLVSRVNETLWNGSAGGHFASLFYGKVRPDSGELEYCAAGDVAALVSRASGVEAISSGAQPLGTDPEGGYARRQQRLSAGDRLILFKLAGASARDRTTSPVDVRRLVSAIDETRSSTTEEMLAALRAAVEAVAPGSDHSLLVVERLR